MITWRGFSWLLLTVLVYLVLALSGYDLLIFLFLVLLTLPLFSGLQQRLAGRRLQVDQKLTEPVVERGNPVHLVIRLQQSGRLSHGELDLVVRRPGAAGRLVYERKLLPLLAGHPVEISCQIDCPHRGHYSAGIHSLYTRDLLGLFYLPLSGRQFWRRRFQELIVLPRPENIPGTDDLVSRLADWQLQQIPHIGDDIDAVASLRSHRPGDSLKRTHWKVSARLNEIMIKEFENPIRREGLLILDPARPGRSIAAGLDLGDYFMDRAAFLAQLVLGTGNVLRTVAYQPDGRQEQHAAAPADLHLTQVMLAGLDWTDNWPPDQVLAAETSLDKPAWFVLLLTTRLDLATARQLSQLQNRGLLVWLILIDEKPGDPAQAEASQLLAETQVPQVVLHRHQNEVIKESEHVPA